jgi:branched-chain amino acid transport system substrate-binding protein
MRSKGAAVVAVLLAASAGVVAGCGGGDDSSSGSSGSGAASKSSKPVKILFVGDFSGATKVTAQEQFAGLKAGVRYWNAKGGFNGRQAQVDSVNTNGEPATAVSATTKYLSSHPAPDFVWAGAEGNEISAMIPFVSKRGLVSMAVNDGHSQCRANAATECPTFFSIGGDVAIQANSAAAHFKEIGAKNVGILEEGIAFTQSETGPMEKALDAQGIKHEKVTFPATAVDVTSQISELKSKGADAIEAEVYGPATAYALAGRSKLGWTSAPLIFDAAGSAVDVSKLAKSPGDIKNAFVNIAPPTDGNLDIAGVKEMVAQSKAANVPIGGTPLYVAAFGWDAMALYHAVLESTKSTDPKVVAKTLVNLPEAAQNDPMYTLQKKIVYSADSHINQGLVATDYRVVPVGAITDGQLHPAD